MAIDSTFFISHGSPTLTINESLPARHFMKGFKERWLAERPSAILVISGHWETSEPAVLSITGRHDTIHDFYGFPEPMYQLKYPAPGAPDLAKKVMELLMASGFTTVHEENKRGLDHGVWVPLILMYPETDIPVCQLSVQPDKDATYHYNMGRALASLKHQGVLIIGSGSATHNLKTLDSCSGVAPWALEFDDWLKDALLTGRHEDINHYDIKAPHAKVSHPRPDHIYPLHVALGAADEGAKGELIHHSWDRSTLSYASYKFSS